MIDFTPLDRLVQRAHLDALQRWSAAPHRLRWWPLLPIGACLLGIAMLGAAPNRFIEGLAMAPLSAAAGVCGAIRIWGPVRIPSPGQPLDEREHLLRLRANAIGYGAVAWGALALAFWMVASQLLPLPRPTTVAQWLAVVLTTQTLILMLPVLAASWMLEGPLGEAE